MLKQGLKLHIMSWTDLTLPKENSEKVNWCNERWIRWKNHERICWIKSHNLQLIDDSREDKKVKCTKKCVVKRKLKFEYYKHCLEATQLENKINHQEKNKIDIDNLKEDHKEFMKTIILKTQQRFRSKKHNAFTEEINKIALSPNHNIKKNHTHVKKVGSTSEFLFGIYWWIWKTNYF